MPNCILCANISARQISNVLTNTLTAIYQYRKRDRGLLTSIPRTYTKPKVRLPPFFAPRLFLTPIWRSNDERPTAEASAARKRLVEAFAHYDAAAKRIRNLSCARGSSQDRVQTAILGRANLFLQKNMFPLQVWTPTPFTAISRTNRVPLVHLCRPFPNQRGKRTQAPRHPPLSHCR